MKIAERHANRYFVPPEQHRIIRHIETPQPKDLTISDTTYQVISSEDSRTFKRVENEKIDHWCQKIQEDIPQTCLITSTAEEEDVPMYRKNLRKIFDSNFIVAAT